MEQNYVTDCALCIARSHLGPDGQSSWTDRVLLPRLCDCRIFRLLPHILAKCAYRIFSRINWHFRRHVLILFVFLLHISVTFRYLDHLVANRMTPSISPDPRGTRWGSWFQAILYDISAYFCRIFGVCAVRIFFYTATSDMPN